MNFPSQIRINLIRMGRSIVNSGPASAVGRHFHSLYYRFRSTLFRGSEYECPCCGGSFRNFIRSGKNRKCPGCNSYQRHRFLELFLSLKTNLYSTPTRILHVAPEFGLQKKLKSFKNISHVSIDLCSPLADKRMDLTRLEFPSCSFDAVICFHVLEKIPEDRAAVREMFRILKPGGWAIIQVPIELSSPQTFCDAQIDTPLLRERTYGEFDDQRLYGRDFYDVLRELGFNVETHTLEQEIDESLIKKCVLRKDSGKMPQEICYCTKPTSIESC